MTETANLSLPYLAPAQAQKHVTVNETFRKLDALVQLAVVSATTTAEPGSPNDGEVYILPSGKTGAAWGAMTTGALAYYVDGAWMQLTPREGFIAFAKDSNKLLIYDGAAWNEHMAGSAAASGVTVTPAGNLGSTDVQAALEELQGDINGLAAIGENLLLNGDFQVNQRSYTGGALSAGDYGRDRWKASGAGAADYSLSGYVLTLASGEIEQIVVPGQFGLASFASLGVTVSVDTPSQDLTVAFGSQSGTITAGAGRRSVTLTLGGGDAGNLSFKLKRAAAGSVTFGRVKLEIGAAATAWQFRAHEEVLCRRYYEVIRVQILGYGGGGSNGGIQLSWAPKRATPSLTRLANNVVFTESNCGTGPATATGTLANGALFYRPITATGAFQFSESWAVSAEL